MTYVRRLHGVSEGVIPDLCEEVPSCRALRVIFNVMRIEDCSSFLIMIY